MTSADNRDKKSRRKTIRFAVLAAVVVVGLWWLLGSILPERLANSWDERGQRGDAFGMVNSLFAGLAFVGLIVAIALQSQELRLQRGELKLTREEMDRQASALEGQLAAAASQRFDSTFFQMVRLHGDIVESVRIRVSNREIDGRTALTHHYRILGQFLGPVKIDPGVVGKAAVEAEVQKLRDAYDNWYDRSKTDLGHYFRSLYHIVKFVDGSEIEDKKTYIGILRAQLSSPELGLVFYNMIGPGFDKFFPLILRYELLQNLPVVALHKPEHATLMQSYVAEWWGHPLVLSGSPY